MPASIEQLIEQASTHKASDIHIACGVPVKYRVVSEIHDMNDDVLTIEDCEAYAHALLGDDYHDVYVEGELDFAKTIAGRRIRANMYLTSNTISIALRLLNDQIPTLDSLGLPKVISQFPSYNKGIVLVTGETGSGKSTTMAAILNEVNHTRYEHIITLEDPIEYVYQPDKCLISQREVGTDTKTYADGLRAILREDPDIILIGELRDIETIDIALTAAETGHLVLATLHTNSAVESVDRIVGTFPAQRQSQIRLQLSTTLKAVVSQQLVVNSQKDGRVAACEVMIVTPAIRNQIREGKTAQMESSLLTSAKEGSITMDNCLLELVNSGKISVAEAINHANHPESFKSKTQLTSTHMGFKSY